MEERVKHHFQSLLNTNVSQVVHKLPNKIANYSHQLWQFIRIQLMTLLQATEVKGFDSIFNLLVKLMDEESLKQINQNYQFLYFGKRMKTAKRLALVKRQEDQQLFFRIYTLIQLIGKEELLEYRLILCTLVETHDLTPKKMISQVQRISSPTKIRLQEKIKQSKQKQQKYYRQNEILNQIEINEALQVLMPINLTEIAYLVSNFLSEQHLAKFKGQKVYILTGPTGIGKSTLILYLLGYQIKIMKIGDYKQTVPIDVKQQHKNIVSKSAITSVTNTIHFAGFTYEGNHIAFTDTPGDGDSRGTTRRFFNYLLKRKLYQSCNQTVMIDVICIDSLIRQRINGIKKYAQYIVNNYEFKDWKDLRQKVVVIINKCDNSYIKLSGLIQDLNRIRSQRISHGKESEVITFLYMVLQGYSKDVQNIPIAIPTNFYQIPSKRQQLLKYLIKIQANDPKDVIKGTLDKDIKNSIDNLYNYMQKCCDKWLQEKRYDIVLYYYKAIQLIPRLYPSILLSSQINQKLKANFKQHYKSFKSIISREANKIYEEKDFIDLIFQMEKLKQGLKFFNYLKQLKDIEIDKSSLINSYKQKFKEGACTEEIVRNYKRFIDIFQLKEDPVQDVILSNHGIFQQLARILTDGQNYEKFDEKYAIFTRNSGIIINFDPNKAYELPNKLENYIEKTIKQMNTNLINSIRQQISYISSLGHLEDTHPSQRHLQLRNWLQNYQALSLSEVIFRKKSFLQSSKQVQNQLILLDNLSNLLSQKIKQFGNLILSKQKSASKEIINYFKIINKPYLEITQISQKMYPHLEKLQEQINQAIKKCSQIIQNFKQMFKTIITTSEVMPSFKFDGQIFRKQISKLQIYMQYAQIPFNSQSIFNQMITELKQAHSNLAQELTDHQSIKMLQEKDIFLKVVNKYTKFQTISQVFPEFIEEISPFIQIIQDHLQQFIKQKQQRLSQNMKLARFAQEIQQKKIQKYLNELRYISFICSKLQSINYGDEKLKKLIFKFTEIYQNCQMLAKFDISYERAIKIRQNIDNTIVSSQTLFSVFHFLNQIIEISHFNIFFKDKNNDVRMIIISKFQRELLMIQTQIQQKVQKKQFYQNDPVFIKILIYAKCDFNAQMRKPVYNEPLVKMEEKKKKVIQYAYSNINENVDIPKLKIDQRSTLQSVTKQFVSKRENQKFHPQNRQNLYFQYHDYIMRKINEDQQILINAPERYIKNRFLKLLGISQKLMREEKIVIKELNSFIIQMEEKIESVIQQYYLDINNLFRGYQLKQAQSNLNRIQDLLKKTQFNQDKFKDRQLKNNIQTLKQKIQAQNQKILSLKNRYIKDSIINIYEDFQSIIFLAKSESLSGIRNDIEQKIYQQIESLSTNQDHLKFTQKIQFLRRYVYLIYSNNYDRRNHLMKKFQQSEVKYKRNLQSLIQGVNYKDNYTLMMELMYKCRQMYLCDSLDKIRLEKNNFLEDLFNKISRAEDKEIQELFELLAKCFWIDNNPPQIKQYFLKENQDKQKLFLNEIVRIKINPEIIKVQKFIMKKDRESPRKMNENAFLSFLNLLNRYRQQFYSKQICEKLSNEIKQKLMKIYSCRLQSYHNILQVQDSYDYQYFHDQIKFGRKFESLNALLIKIDPQITPRVTKVSQFQAKVRTVYQKLVQLNFQTLSIQLFSDSTNLQEYLIQIENNLCLVQGFMSIIKDYDERLIENISRRLSEYVKFCIDLLKNFFKGHEPDHQWSQIDVEKALKLERVMRKMIRNRHSFPRLMSKAASFLDFQEQPFIKTIEHIIVRCLADQIRSHQVDTNKQTIILMKKISIYLPEFTQECSKVILRILNCFRSTQKTFMKSLINAIRSREGEQHYSRICKEVLEEYREYFRL